MAECNKAERLASAGSGGSLERRQGSCGKLGELIYTIQRDTGSARAFVEDIRTRCAKRDRDLQAVKIMPGLILVLADTDAQAAKIQAELDGLVDPDYAITRLAGMLNVPVSILGPNKLCQARGTGKRRRAWMQGSIRLWLC